MPSVQRCPMLGLKDDEQSRLSFASVSHACYRSGKAKPIAVEYQRQYCLEKEHITCPIFLDARLKQASIPRLQPLPQTPIPIEDTPVIASAAPSSAVKPITPEPQAAQIARVEIPATISSKPTRPHYLWEAVGVGIFLLLLLGGWWLFNNRDLFFPNQSPVQASLEQPFAETSQPAVSPSDLAQTVSPVPAACTTVPDGWVSYTVAAGDSLSSLAAAFHVSADTLITANCLMDLAITPGQLLFLPPQLPTQ